MPVKIKNLKFIDKWGESLENQVVAYEQEPIRKGEIVGTVNNALLMGNMLDAVRNIEMIGNDSKQMGVINVPTMSFSGMELVGN